MRQRRIGILLVAAALCLPGTLFAQSEPPLPVGPTEDPADTARVRLGPLFLQPDFGLRNVGIDNNVFNDLENPERDWTATLRLGMLAGLRFGPARFTVKTLTDYIWYAHFRSERSIDGATRYQFEVRSPRVRPWIAYDKIKTHERPNYEIDARAGRTSPTYEAGLEYRIGYRLGTRLVARHREMEYQPEEEFRGVNLGDVLNNQMDDAELQFLYELSPLSSLRLTANANRTRFDTASERDADDVGVMIGIEGGRDAGLSGTVDIGWKERSARAEGAPEYSGLVARGGAAFILAEQVRVAFAVDRDTQWSYEQFYTFYVQSGGSATVTWRPHQRLDLLATGKHYWLDYEEGLDERAVPHVDKVYSYGGGFGFFIRGYPGTRLGITIERTARESIFDDRRYDALRYYTNVGFSF